MCNCADPRCPDCRMLSGACTCPAPTPCEAAHGRDTPPERPGGFRAHDRRPPAPVSQCGACERLEAAQEARDSAQWEVHRLSQAASDYRAEAERLTALVTRQQRDLDLASACLDRLRTELALGPKKGDMS